MAWTSPRTTKPLHELCDLARLLRVSRVLRERGRLRCESGPPTFPISRLRDRLARRLGSAHPSPAGDLVERAQPITAEPERKGRYGRHAAIVAQFALHCAESRDREAQPATVGLPNANR